MIENIEATGLILLALLVLLWVIDVAARRQRKRVPGTGQKRSISAPAIPDVEGKAVASGEKESDPVSTVIAEAPLKLAETSASAPSAESDESVLARMKRGLKRTHGNLVDGLASLVLGQKTINEDLLEEIEAQLLLADVGVEATNHIVQVLTASLKRSDLADSDALYQALKNELRELLAPCTAPLDLGARTGPFVVLMVGVNGAGKTTTIGKLAKRFQNDGLKVMLAAGDTFRAAAVEQLEEWGRRNDVPVVAQHTGADSASVIYDALESARARGIDVLIADTAGRLQNKDNLMAELSKIKRVMAKLDEQAPHEVMLVLDAGTGQNALSQAKLFNEAVGVTGITLTKLDGTAKGGVIFAVAKQMSLPIRFIGVGEKIDDLRPFDADQFVAALFD
ncbi:MAG: signal recognition particle-docking protein FtsY [Pseudomonadales bacterium]